jgi:purine-binding chemotaxis protein CheW
MDLVNFQVGAKTVALPILNILLTERFGNDLTELPNENPSFIGVKDFMNLPVPVFDLGKILNGSSTSDSNKSLAATLSNLKDDV